MGIMKKLSSKYNAVLRWWLIFTGLCVGAFFAHYMGLFQLCFNADKTPISMIILSIFGLFTLMAGIDTFKLCRFGYIKNIEKRLRAGWFFADALITLGMTGTVIGFIMMLQDFRGDLLDTTTAITTLSRGMGTALFTTAAGIITSLLLKLQLFNATEYLEECKEDD